MTISNEKLFEVALLFLQAFGLYLVKRSRDATVKNREKIQQVDKSIQEVRQVIYEAPQCRFYCPAADNSQGLDNRQGNQSRGNIQPSDNRLSNEPNQLNG